MSSANISSEDEGDIVASVMPLICGADDLEIFVVLEPNLSHSRVVILG